MPAACGKISARALGAAGATACGGNGLQDGERNPPRAGPTKQEVLTSTRS